MKRLLLGMAALGLFLGVTGQAKANYTFTTLDPPGSISIFTEAEGINSGGEIVGASPARPRPGPKAQGSTTAGRSWDVTLLTASSTATSG